MLVGLVPPSLPIRTSNVVLVASGLATSVEAGNRGTVWPLVLPASIAYAALVESGGQFDRYHGKGMESLFPEGSAPKTTIPFPAANRRKDRPGWDIDTVHAALREPRQTSHIDPRELHASQSSVTRPGVSHYMSGEYERSGRTYADQGDPGNARPIVYSRPRHPEGPESDREHVLLSGHHRATAALLKGEQLEHIAVNGPWGPSIRG